MAKSKTKPIRVMVVDSYPMVRMGLGLIIKEDSSMTVVGEAADGANAIEYIKRLTPDVVALETSIPKVSGFGVMDSIKKHLPKTEFLVVTSDLGIESIVKAVDSGARGYILKTSKPDVIQRAIITVNDGDNFFGSGVSEVLLKNQVGTRSQDRGLDLTKREAETLLHISNGLTSKEIASKMELSLRTVGTYRHQIMAKYGLSAGVGLIRFACENADRLSLGHRGTG